MLVLLDFFVLALAKRHHLSQPLNIMAELILARSVKWAPVQIRRFSGGRCDFGCDEGASFLVRWLLEKEWKCES